MSETEYAAAPPRGIEFGVADNRDDTFDVYDLTNETTLLAKREVLGSTWLIDGIPDYLYPAEYRPLVALLDDLWDAHVARMVAA